MIDEKEKNLYEFLNNINDHIETNFEQFQDHLNIKYHQYQTKIN